MVCAVVLLALAIWRTLAIGRPTEQESRDSERAEERERRNAQRLGASFRKTDGWMVGTYDGLATRYRLLPGDNQADGGAPSYLRVVLEMGNQARLQALLLLAREYPGVPRRGEIPKALPVGAAFDLTLGSGLEGTWEVEGAPRADLESALHATLLLESLEAFLVLGGRMLELEHGRLTLHFTRCNNSGSILAALGRAERICCALAAVLPEFLASPSEVDELVAARADCALSDEHFVRLSLAPVLLFLWSVDGPIASSALWSFFALQAIVVRSELTRLAARRTASALPSPLCAERLRNLLVSCAAVTVVTLFSWIANLP